MNQDRKVLSMAIGTFIGNWRTQLLAYSIIFAIVLSAALVADLVFGVSESVVVRWLPILVSLLFFLVPISMAVLSIRSEKTAVSSKPKTRILMVDDEESILFSTKEYLTMHGYEVDTAGEYDDAKNLMVRENYSLVILDTAGIGEESLPREESLIGMVAFVRRAQPKTKVMALTSLNLSQEDVTTRFDLDKYIRKPKQLSLLKKEIEKLVKDSSAQSNDVKEI